MCEIRRSAYHSAKTEHFNVAISNFFNFAKIELFNVAKTEYCNVAKTESLMSQKMSFLMSRKLNFLTSQKLSILSHKIWVQKQSSGDVLQKKVFLEISKNSQENTCTRDFIKNASLAQVFSCEFSKNTYFYRTPPVAASVNFNMLQRLSFVMSQK